MTWKRMEDVLGEVVDDPVKSGAVTPEEAQPVSHNRKDTQTERNRSLCSLPGYSSADAEAAYVAVAYAVREVTTKTTVRTWMSCSRLVKLELDPSRVTLSVPTKLFAELLNEELAERFYTRFRFFIRFTVMTETASTPSVAQVVNGDFPPPEQPLSGKLLKAIASRKKKQKRK